MTGRLDARSDVKNRAGPRQRQGSQELPQAGTGLGCFDLWGRRRAGALALEGELALMLLPQRRESSPIVAAHEQQQEGRRQIVEAFDREGCHREEPRAEAEFRVAEPPPAPPG